MAIASFVVIADVNATEAPVYSSERHDFRLATVVDGLNHPWGLAFLPDGDILVTERPGRLRIVRGGTLLPMPVDGVPAVAARGQGGLLDVALHPEFHANRLVYLSYAGPGPGGAGTEVARGAYEFGRLRDVETILIAGRKTRSGSHFGSRLAFGRDGHLYVSVGERGRPDRAQDLSDPAGSIIRIADDGSIPDDNPFVGRGDASPAIFSYGHRNPQGLVVHPETGALWAIEHGPFGGDELNLLAAGANYGWPVVTFGLSYSGLPIGEGTAKPGMTQPVHYWVLSISPSGLAVYVGKQFPAWRGNFFVGALSARALVRLELDGTDVKHEERLLTDIDERIRDVRQGPDGYLYLLTDAENGRLLRLEPLR